MGKALSVRLAKLEAKDTRESWGVCALWDREGVSEEELQAEAIASGRARPEDRFILRTFWQPGPNGPQRVYLPQPEGYAA